MLVVLLLFTTPVCKMDIDISDFLWEHMIGISVVVVVLYYCYRWVVGTCFVFSFAELEDVVNTSRLRLVCDLKLLSNIVIFHI